jgi:hypothetical protein
MGNCSITTRLLATNATASGSISLCSAEGIVPGSAVAGIGSAASRGLLLADGKCLSTADCNATGALMCSLSSSPRQLCLCNAATGADECTTYGTCVRTPCKVCSDCLTSLGREYISRQLYETDAAKIAAGFHSYCTSNSLGTSAVCTELAAAINVSTPTGNRGKPGQSGLHTLRHTYKISSIGSPFCADSVFTPVSVPLLSRILRSVCVLLSGDVQASAQLDCAQNLGSATWTPSLLPAALLAAFSPRKA